MKQKAARNIVGIFGNVISCGLFCSPIPTFMRILKKRATEEFEADPYIATALNCGLWTFYALPFVHPHSLLVLTINTFGAAVELIYIVIFLIFATSQGRKKVGIMILVGLVFLAIVIVVTLTCVHGTPTRSLVVGIIAVIITVVMYASPLTVMKKVIQTRSVRYMPFCLSMASFLNGCVWTAYSLLEPRDLFVLISNCVGVVSGSLQLSLYAYFYFFGVKDVPEEEEEDNRDKTKKQDIELTETQSA